MEAIAVESLVTQLLCEFVGAVLRRRLLVADQNEAVDIDSAVGLTAGDARLAIGILRTAANKADRENRDRITDDILLKAEGTSRDQEYSLVDSAAASPMQ